MERCVSVLTLTFGTAMTAQLSAPLAGGNLHLRIFLGTHFCQRLSAPQGCWMWTEGWGHLKISKEPTGNRTRNLPSCDAVPHPAAPPCNMKDVMVRLCGIFSLARFLSLYLCLWCRSFTAVVNYSKSFYFFIYFVLMTNKSTVTINL